MSLDWITDWQARLRSRLAEQGLNELKKAVDADLDALRTGKARLDVVSTPEPAKNEGGSVSSGDPSSPAPRPKWFADGTGLF